MGEDQTSPTPCEDCGLTHSPFVACYEEAHHAHLNPARLNEIDAEEMWDACRALRPDLTRDRFNQDMAEFAAEKLRRQAIPPANRLI